jgi:hypothetical protein
LKALLASPKDFAERLVRVIASKRLLAAGAVAFLVNPNLDRCQGQPDPANSQVLTLQLFVLILVKAFSPWGQDRHQDFD